MTITSTSRNTLSLPATLRSRWSADCHGNIMHLGTRDCSIQRRHQKLLEIAPVNLPPSVIEAIHEAAVKAARQANYVNAGTVEFSCRSRQQRILVHGGQHAAAGRTHCNGNVDRHRYCPAADPDCGAREDSNCPERGCSL